MRGEGRGDWRRGGGGRKVLWPHPLSFLPGSLGPPPQGRAPAGVGASCHPQALRPAAAAPAPPHAQHQGAELWLLAWSPFPGRQLGFAEPLERRRPLASQEEVSLARKELAVAQDSSWGPRLGGARPWARQSRLRSSEETLLLKKA